MICLGRGMKLPNHFTRDHNNWWLYDELNPLRSASLAGAPLRYDQIYHLESTMQADNHLIQRVKNQNLKSKLDKIQTSKLSITDVVGLLLRKQTL